MHFVKWMHIAHRSTSWSEHLEFAWNNTCVYEYNKFIICNCNTSFPLDLVWSILVTHAECWKKTKHPGHAQVNLCIQRSVCCTVAQFFCFIPYLISNSSACYVYKQYAVYTYTCMYNTKCISVYLCIPKTKSISTHETTPRFDRPWLFGCLERLVAGGFGCPDP